MESFCDIENETAKGRAVGSLLGLAVGDALGTTLEFYKRDSLPPVSDLVGGGHFRLDRGQWTDDTAMALCLAESLIDTGFDLRDQLERYLRWVNEGYFSSTGKCFGIGQQTFRALGDFSRTGQILSSYSGSRSAGNGSLMRLAPVPIATYLNLEQTYKISAASSITTHPNLECIEACAAYGTLIAGALQGWTKEAIISFGQELSSEITSDDLSVVLSGSYLDKTRDQISSSGYVVHTLEAALWAFARTDDFKAGALLAVNLADDADTVGAVYGQLAGAHYGVTGIPGDWIGHLDQSAMIMAMAEQLHNIAGALSVSTESSPHLNIIQPDSALFSALTMGND